jgi:hypothetical protein
MDYPDLGTPDVDTFTQEAEIQDAYAAEGNYGWQEQSIERTEADYEPHALQRLAEIGQATHEANHNPWADIQPERITPEAMADYEAAAEFEL